MKFDKDELNIYEVESIYQTLLKEFDAGNIILDMQNVNKIDMSVIQLFISAYESAKESSKKFEFKNVNSEVSNILKNSGCDFLEGVKI
jgi:anti-anti-sigma factor